MRRAIIKTSSEMRRGENRNGYWNNSYNRAGTCACGCDSDLGLQQQLGLWSEWRPRSFAVNSSDSGSVGPNIAS